MTPYRLLRASHVTQRKRTAGCFNIRHAFMLSLTIVGLWCTYWIQFSYRKICMVGAECSVNRSSAIPSPQDRIVPSPMRRAQSMYDSRTDLTEPSLKDADISKRYSLYTEKCHLLSYDFNDPVVKQKYYWKKPKKCSADEKPFIFFAKLNITGGYSCFDVNETLYEMFYANSFKLDNCTYRQAVRSLKHSKIDYYHAFEDPERLKVGACPRNDLLWVDCGVSGTGNSYAQPLFMPVVKPVTESIRGNNMDQKPLHVLVVGLDSMSRLNAHRQFPMTLAYLQKKPNLVELFGYIKIGMNSAPNQIPLLTGIPFKKFNEPGLAYRSSKTHFDNLTRFLWDDFGSRGYRSLFLEEQWFYGLFLYPPMSGFHKAPTTYWPRPLMQAIDESSLKKGTCIGPDQAAKYYLDYTYHTLKILGSERPLFAYSWLSEAAHDNINGGQLDDEYFLDFFTRLSEDKILEDTAVFFISDHGMRFGNFRNTLQGRLEDMMPYGFVLMPDRFFASYPEAKKTLDLNAQRIVTMYDLHATLLELTDAWNEDRLTRTANGYSIFSNVIPSERTCKDAGIDIEFCPCYQLHPEDTNSSRALSMGTHIVKQLNEKLKQSNATRCREYELANVTEFIRLSEGEGWTDFYRATVELKPFARFEVTCEHGGSSTYEWHIVSDFDRLDRYNYHSECAQGLPFEKYCYCSPVSEVLRFFQNKLLG